MKQISKLACLIIVIGLAMPSIVSSQSADPAQKQLLEAARSIMNAAESCALITLDQEGRPRVRAMDAFLPEKDFTVWFGTNRHSRKVEQLKNDSRVTLYYLEKNSAGYVMLHGTAQLVDNQKEKEKRWKPAWEAFYDDKESDYLLIKVTPEWMEVVSYTHGFLGDQETWEPPVYYFTSN